jgi:hypothetical protein
VKKQARIILAAERKMKHEQAMELIRKKQEDELVVIANKDIEKAKKAAKLIKETI